MPTYLILVSPSANRVYAGAAASLVRCEVRAMARAAVLGSVDDEAVTEVVLGGVGYVALDAPAPLTEDALRTLSNVSSALAFFERQGELLRPITAYPLDRYPSDLLTIQKYPGKTNEHFTKLLLNVTAMATAYPHKLLTGDLRVLDPLCGRGTTLNQALMYGLSSTGVDLDKKDFEAYTTFLQTWLKRGRFKHAAATGALTLRGVHRGRRFDVTTAPSKTAYAVGDVTKLTYLNTDSTALDDLLAAGSHHVVVADLPYGVQHGSHARGGLDRQPLDLLAAALPGWHRILAPGGALGLAYNRHVVAPTALASLIGAAGLEVIPAPSPDGYRHRVDQSIDRDIVVARKPATSAVATTER